ncbi:MAG: peptidoglycan editing factor PgeF [Betaproteobacteria bacterium]|nr:peptidoglycan editing factor PgeF [Betaproteobacteria bacterium]
MIAWSDLLQPVWAAPANVRAVMTTRQGGNSTGPYDSLNLGVAVGDDPERVARNRDDLARLLPGAPRWLTQIHGTRVVDAADTRGVVEADASFTTRPGVVCVIQTADCLPVLFARSDGTAIAASHAGWRGLAAGVLENTVTAIAPQREPVVAWLGPAIGPGAYQVGRDVRDAFVAGDPSAETAFAPDGADHWRADLYALARLRLARLGVTSVAGGDRCTFTEQETFYSHRRDGVTGRMAALVWLTA